ncbi:MAG: TonB-dependent receptor [Chitinophagaceae bacterium]|nr:TonB-dependent receptor [Chitinophagaceae bacterium]
MRSLLLFSVLIYSAFSLNAQEIAGSVKDAQGKALEKATISLLNAKDSSVIKLATTNASGAFTLTTTRTGRFLISASYVGYKPVYSAVFEQLANTKTTLPDLTISQLAGEMKGVTVTAKKPLVEVRADKTILNVEGTINAVGNDAMELLRKSPGIMIDKDDNISLAGKNGVQVYIDGKPSPLSGTDLANFLKSMQSSQIEAIEIITNPSAKYEAAGNAGIINIRLKKNKSFGTNGSVNAGITQGKYAKGTTGINLNYRNKSVNLFGNYNYNKGTNQMWINMRREQFDTLFDQRNQMNFRYNTHGFKAGMDYFINANSTLGAAVTGNLATNDMNTAGPMYFIYQPTSTTVKILDATNHNDTKRNNVNTNINYRYANKKGSELNLDGDYGFFTIRSDQYQPNYYKNPNGTEISRVIYSMLSPTDIDLFSFKADYEKNYKGGRLGIGGKVGIVTTDNDFRRYDVLNNGKILDTAKSNRFKYDENINALYVNYNKQLKKGFMIQVGLRVENTHSDGKSTGFKKSGSQYVNYDSSFKRDYTDVFPTASLTFNKNPMSQFTVSFSRRIDRPAYQDLNPFEFKLNEYTYMKGNTQLRPQYTNSFGLTHVYKYRLTTALNYSHVNDIFAQIPDTIDKTKGFLTKKNLAQQDVVALNISYPFQYKWYGFFVTMNTNYSKYQADFGGGSRKVDQSVLAMTFYMQNSFKLGKGWTAELSGLYISPSIWQGMFKSGGMGTIDGGFQKTVLKGNGTVRMAVSDMLQTMKWKGTSNFTGVNSRFSGNGEMPQFKLNFSYRFGNSQVKAARQRKSAIEDEKKRTEGGGGGMIGQ